MAVTSFWEQVAQAHDQVSLKQELRVVIEAERKSAFVSYDNALNVVLIKVKDMPTTETKEVLPVP